LQSQDQVAGLRRPHKVRLQGIRLQVKNIAKEGKTLELQVKNVAKDEKTLEGWSMGHQKDCRFGV
jgi:hypothetical protein